MIGYKQALKLSYYYNGVQNIAIELSHFQCKIVVCYGKKHAFGGYSMNGQPLTSVDCYKDLGVSYL